MSCRGGSPIALFALTLAAVCAADPSPEPPPRWKTARDLGRMSEWGDVVAISPDGRRLVLRDYSTFGYVYDLPTGKVVGEFATKETLQDAAVSPDGRWLATAEWQDGVKLRDFGTLRALKTLRGDAKLAASQLRFSRDGKTLGVHSWWHTQSQLWSYDLAADKVTSWAMVDNGDKGRSALLRESFRSGPLLFGVERERDDKGRLYDRHRLWATDPATGKKSDPIDVGKRDYHQFDLSPDGTKAVVMRPGDAPRIVSMKTGETLQTLDGHTFWATAAAFSPRGGLVVTGSGPSPDGFALPYTDKRPPTDGSPRLVVHSVGTKRPVGTLELADRLDDVTRVGFSPDGKYVFAVTRKKRVLLWGELPPIAAKADALPDAAAKFEAKKRPK